MNDCSLLVVVLVFLHVSDLYSSTDFSPELNNLSLVLDFINFYIHKFASAVTAAHAFCVLILIPLSILPSVSTLHSKYVYDSTS